MAKSKRVSKKRSRKRSSKAPAGSSEERLPERGKKRRRRSSGGTSGGLPSRGGRRTKSRSRGRRPDSKLAALLGTAEERLREVWGFPSLRPRQRQAVETVLAGRDLLLTMPTGSGKSLCYQLPALVLEGTVLVVSPLIALMKDQVDGLRRHGVRARAIHSGLSSSARSAILREARAGTLDLLYVAPERFRSRAFRTLLPALTICRLAIDEAHCVSQWGNDFRPDYSRLGEYRALCGNPPTLALTATATPKVARDITRVLGLSRPRVLREGIERPNLFLATTRVRTAEEKLPLLAERIRSLGAKGGAGIVYSAVIRDLEWLHAELRRRGIEALVYHGKLSDRERREMQERFMEEEGAVMLATNAFGMGVDKPDIRFVLHAQIPRTLEAWTQEVGRAGRDGEPAWCELFYFQEDLAIQQAFVEWANPDLEFIARTHDTLRRWGERVQAKDLDDLREELVVKSRGDGRLAIVLKWFEVLGVTEGSFESSDLRLVGPLDPEELPAWLRSGKKRAYDLRQLLAMMRFAKNRKRCRRVELQRYFELPRRPPRCPACDVCQKPAAWRRRHFPEARAQGRASPARRSPVEFARGDWVRFGRSLGQVVRVAGKGAGLELWVERASDLERVLVRPAKRRVERLADPPEAQGPKAAKGRESEAASPKPAGTRQGAGPKAAEKVSKRTGGRATRKKAIPMKPAKEKPAKKKPAKKKDAKKKPAQKRSQGKRSQGKRSQGKRSQGKRSQGKRSPGAPSKPRRTRRDSDG